MHTQRHWCVRRIHLQPVNLETGTAGSSMERSWMNLSFVYDALCEVSPSTVHDWLFATRVVDDWWSFHESCISNLWDIRRATAVVATTSQILTYSAPLPSSEFLKFDFPTSSRTPCVTNCMRPPVGGVSPGSTPVKWHVLLCVSIRRGDWEPDVSLPRRLYSVCWRVLSSFK